MTTECAPKSKEHTSVVIYSRGYIRRETKNSWCRTGPVLHRFPKKKKATKQEEDSHVSQWHRKWHQEHSKIRSSFQPKVFWKNYQTAPPFPFPATPSFQVKNKKLSEVRRHSRGKNTGHLNWTWSRHQQQYVKRKKKPQTLPSPSRMIKLNSRASFSTCTRLSRVAVIPVGLHPYCTAHDDLRVKDSGQRHEAHRHSI